MQSIPEPPPVPNGEIVPDKLIASIEYMDKFTPDPKVSAQLVKLIELAELIKVVSLSGIDSPFWIPTLTYLLIKLRNASKLSLL